MKLTPAQIALLGETISSTPRAGWFPVHNPADGGVLAYVQDGTADDTRNAIAAADAAFPAWSGRTAKDRSIILK